MADVFISYASVDRDRVAMLARSLEAEGVRVWWDRHLAPGDAYEDTIEQALTGARVVVVAWTQASTASQWVRSEADYGRVNGRLVPVIIEACEVPRPFDRLHTGDMAAWRGDRGNQGFPELLEAIQSRLEGRDPKPIRWRRRVTLAAMGSTVVGALVVASSLTGIAEATMRMMQRDSFVREASGQLAPTDPAAGTQEGFQEVLADLASSLDKRTQAALTTLQSGSRADALTALTTIAEDQSAAMDSQMRRASTLWRQLGLLLFNDDPAKAIAALETARRFSPDDPAILTPLAALYHRGGRDADARAIYDRMQIDTLPAQESALAMQVRAQAMLDRGQVAAAEQVFQDLLTVAQETDARLTADLQIDLGRAALERFDLSAAEAYFRDAENLARSIDYPRSELFAELNRAEMLIAGGRFDEAGTKLGEARAHAAEQSDTVATVHIQLAATRLIMRNGDPALATEQAVAVGEQARRAGLKEADLQATLLQAEGMLRQGRAIDAAELATRAAFEWRALHNDTSASIAEALAASSAAYGRTPAPEACARLVSAVGNSPTGYSTAEAQRFSKLTACPARP